MNKNIKGSLCIMTATLIWGSTFVAQSVGMNYIGPFTFQAVRCFIAAVGLIPVIFIADHFRHDGKRFLTRWYDRKLWFAGLLCSIPLVIANNLQQIGISSTDAGKSAFITAMYIVIVPLLGIFRHKKPSGLVFISIIMAVAGMYLLCGTGTGGFAVGDSYLIGCAFMFAVQITFIDMYANEVDPLRLNVIQAMICSILSAVIMIFTETPTWNTVYSCWFPLCYAGFLSMGIAFSMQIIGQKYLEATTASILMSTESVFAVIFGWLILHERMTLPEATGCVLLLVAVIVSQLPDRKSICNTDVPDTI